MPFRSYNKGWFAVALLLMLAGCSPEQEPPPLRVSASYWIGYEPLFVAEQHHFFPKGSVHLVENINASTLEQTLQGDSIDAVAVSLSRAINYIETGYDVTIVLVLGWSNGADMVLANPDIKSIADLKGKRVGTETGSVNSYLLIRALQKNGLTLPDIEIVSVPNEDMDQHFRPKNLSAASVYGRAAGLIKKMGTHTLFDSSQIPGEIIDVLLVRTPYLQAYPQRVADLIKGWVAAVDHLNSLEPNAALQASLLEDKDFEENRSLVSFATAQDNQSYMVNDWAKLKRILDRRKRANSLLSHSAKTNYLPTLDNTPFFTVVSQHTPLRGD
ncbi:MAG: ABC transporter substrate-binding protein [Kordiimonadaceae bacterium]|nr:ABC transporter substrate-binding protein [Kordiimonadaceae bacterium]